MYALKRILPFLGMVFVVVLQALYAAYSDGVVNLVEVLNIVIALGAALVTYVVPNLEDGVLAWLKPAVTALSAGLIVVVNALQDNGVTPQTWVMVGIQLLVGLGVVLPANQYAPKHSGPSGPTPV